jgi:hypothetical protein
MDLLRHLQGSNVLVGDKSTIEGATHSALVAASSVVVWMLYM